MEEQQLIQLLVKALREVEIGYTPNSGYEMCNTCHEENRPDLGRPLQHRDGCRWQTAIIAAESYLKNLTD